MWLLNNPLLAVGVEQHIHPELRQRLGALRRYAGILQARRYAIKRVPRECSEALDWLDSLHLGNGAYAVPFLSPFYCDTLLAELGRAESEGVAYTTNELEERAFQIPEFTTQDQCPTLYRALRELHAGALGAVWHLLTGQHAEKYCSIQFAKYNPRGIAHGNWHHDADSDQTTVVSLAPELYTGGGTDLRLGARSFTHVPKLPKGHALLFNGKATLHRGCRVNTGVRDLLVYWNETK